MFNKSLTYFCHLHHNWQKNQIIPTKVSEFWNTTQFQKYPYIEYLLKIFIFCFFLHFLSLQPVFVKIAFLKHAN